MDPSGLSDCTPNEYWDCGEPICDVLGCNNFWDGGATIGIGGGGFGGIGNEFDIAMIPVIAGFKSAPGWCFGCPLSLWGINDPSLFIEFPWGTIEDNQYWGLITVEVPNIVGIGLDLSWLRGGGRVGGGGGIAQRPPANFILDKLSGCVVDGLNETGLPIALDIVGAIPGLGNMVSAADATARAIDATVAFGGGALGIATSMSDKSPYGTIGTTSASAGIVLEGTYLALGTKAIPIAGNILSGAQGVIDLYHFNQIVQACMDSPKD